MPNHTLTVDDVATARELLAASVGKITAHGHLTRARWLDEAEQYLADGQPAEAARRHEWAVEGLVAPAPPATTYRTEDGVELATGDAAYDYYTMLPGRIGRDLDHDGWFDFEHDDGTVAALNGQRICSLEYAVRRGFTGAADALARKRATS